MLALGAAVSERLAAQRPGLGPCSLLLPRPRSLGSGHRHLLLFRTDTQGPCCRPLAGPTLPADPFHHALLPPPLVPFVCLCPCGPCWPSRPRSVNARIKFTRAGECHLRPALPHSLASCNLERARPWLSPLASRIADGPRRLGTDLLRRSLRPGSTRSGLRSRSPSLSRRTLSLAGSPGSSPLC